MFGTLGGQELFLILVIALIVFGPRKLPEIGKSVGKMLNEFRRASNDFKRTIEDEVEADKLRQSLELPRAEPTAHESRPGASEATGSEVSEAPPAEAVPTSAGEPGTLPVNAAPSPRDEAK
jgi:Tat protein translocase TatB subunit